MKKKKEKKKKKRKLPKEKGERRRRQNALSDLNIDDFESFKSTKNSGWKLSEM